MEFPSEIAPEMGSIKYRQLAVKTHENNKEITAVNLSPFNISFQALDVRIELTDTHDAAGKSFK